MPSYLVKEPLLHDGQKYAPEETIELEAKAARDLVRQGVIEPAKPEPKPKTETKPDPKDGAKPKDGEGQ